MIRWVLPIMLVFLSWGFWASEEFKQIAAGVAIFLFGMIALERGFTAFTGGVLERVLKRSTDRLWKSVGFGVVTTTVMQSSSLVSVIAISFLSAGLISLSAGIGIIFGANLGTTTGAWLIAGLGLKVDIAAFSMPMLVFGVIFIMHNHKTLKGLGNLLAGLGFLFLGIHFMKEGFEAFRDTIDLTAFAVAGYPGVFLFTLIGVAATVIMQSSHATLVLIITALAAGQVTYENALALAIGANVGTTITAIIGALGSNIEGKRLAAAHLLFNGVTAAIAIIFIHPLAWTVDSISAGLGIAPDNYTLKLAVFHTVFNTIGVVALIPFTHRLAKRLTQLMPAIEHPRTEPLYLNEVALTVPAAAIEAVRQETVHLYDHSFAIIAHTLGLRGGEILSDVPIDELVARSPRVAPYNVDYDYETTAKTLYSAIVEFVSRAQPTANSEQAERLFALRLASRDVVEGIKAAKHLHKNLARYSQSDTAALRREYNAIRTQLTSVLRRLHHVRMGQDRLEDVFTLEDVKLEMREVDLALNLRIEALLRERQLRPDEATSVMNDSAYAYDIAKKLVAMAETVMGDGHKAQRVGRRTARFQAIE